MVTNNRYIGGSAILAVIGLVFVVLTLAVVTRVVTNPESRAIVEAYARGKSWRDYGNPRLRQAAREAQEGPDIRPLDGASSFRDRTSGAGGIRPLDGASSFSDRTDTDLDVTGRSGGVPIFDVTGGASSDNGNTTGKGAGGGLTSGVAPPSVEDAEAGASSEPSNYSLSAEGSFDLEVPSFGEFVSDLFKSLVR